MMMMMMMTIDLDIWCVGYWFTLTLSRPSSKVRVKVTCGERGHQLLHWLMVTEKQT